MCQLMSILFRSAYRQMMQQGAADESRCERHRDQGYKNVLVDQLVFQRDGSQNDFNGPACVQADTDGRGIPP